MAIICCEQCGAPKGVSHRYVNAVQPEGYPNPAVLCCRGGCHNPGLVWLTETEQAGYISGERDMVPWGNCVKIKVV